MISGHLLNQLRARGAGLARSVMQISRDSLSCAMTRGLWFACLIACPVSAQSQASDQRRHPNLDIYRLASGELAPIIDGDISDSIWQNAPRVDKFYQINPNQGAAPSENTHVRMLYSDTHLYIAAALFDSEPDKITARVMTRDTDVDKDDYFQILLDSFDTGRDSYFFMVSPTGARRDGLTENNSKFTPEWDTIWTAKTQITSDGWQVEMAIPFQSLSYDQNLDSFGLQMRRRITRKNEDIAWALTEQALPTFDLTDRGRLSGISGTKAGLGLEIEGLLTASAERNWQLSSGDQDLEPSANIYYQITPSLTATLSLNTDFSDTPLDPRLVNTDRFSLFFPETREFFLQDQNLFAFGGRPLQAANGLPFFSRRIGLINGVDGTSAIGIDAGAKLSGSVGALNIAALTTRTESTDTFSEQTLSVARLSADIGHDSRIGVIATDGDPLGLTDNQVYGFDAQYKNTELFNGQQIGLDAYYLRSNSSDSEQDGESYGAELIYPNDALNYFLRFKHIDETYAPALGFVNRAGIRDYDGQLRLRRRYDKGNVRFDAAGVISSLVTDLDGDTQSVENGAYLQRVWQDGSNVLGFALYGREVIEEPFTIADGKSGVVVDVGDYDWTRGDIVYSTGESRNWGFSAEVECCDWYDGERFTFVGSAFYRPSKYLNLKTDYSLNSISVSGGDVDINVFSLDGIINITPDMQISNQLQYDNISENMGYFGRFRWALRAETELLITASHGAQVDSDTFESIQSGISIRIGNSYRF